MTRKLGSVKTRHLVVSNFRHPIFGPHSHIKSKEHAYKTTILPVWNCIHPQRQIWNFGRFLKKLVMIVKSPLLLYNFPKFLIKHGWPASEWNSNLGCRIYEFFSGNTHCLGKFQTYAIVRIPIKFILISHSEKFQNYISVQSPGCWKISKWWKTVIKFVINVSG